MPHPGQVYATHEDLTGVWRPLDSTEQQVATNLLVYTSALLRLNVPRLSHRIADAEIDPVLVELAAVMIVRRVMMNPAAARQRSVTTGPFTHSITVDSAVSSGALYVGPDDLALFLPPAPERQPKIGTARLRAGLAPCVDL